MLKKLFLIALLLSVILGCTRDDPNAQGVIGTRLYVYVYDQNNNTEIGGASVRLFISASDCDANQAAVAFATTNNQGLAMFGRLNAGQVYHIRADRAGRPAYCTGCTSPPTVQDQVVEAQCRININ